jgi:hypothetical protein
MTANTNPVIYSSKFIHIQSGALQFFVFVFVFFILFRVGFPCECYKNVIFVVWWLVIKMFVIRDIKKIIKEDALGLCLSYDMRMTRYLFFFLFQLLPYLLKKDNKFVKKRL